MIESRLARPSRRARARTARVERSDQHRLLALAIAVSVMVAMAIGTLTANAHPVRGPGEGPHSVSDLAASLQGSVVNISTTQTLKASRGIPLPKVPKGSPFEEFFEDFFNRQQKEGRPRRVSSLGSGFVIDASGLIVTNNHVIAEADEIEVNFSDGTKLKVVEVVGRDTKADLALLRVEPEKPLKALEFGDSNAMKVGDWVMAIGNPFGLGGTVTLGIISAKKRDINAGPYDEFLQTDAAINRGNSGGPLFDMSGKVVGVNTAIISPTGGSIGIGFAIPAATATHIISQLREFGETRRGWLGVRIQTVTDEIADSLGLAKPSGALVASVTPESPAAQAGIEATDVITKFDGQDVPNMRVLPRIVARTKIGTAVKVEILRKGKTLEFEVTIGRLPDDDKPKAAKADEPKKEEKKEYLLGLSISPLSEALRKKYGISEKVKGVVVTDVEATSTAAQKNIKPGDVIVEVTEEEVKTPADVSSRVDSVKKAGRKSVLLLISDAKGELRFVAVPIKG